MHNFFITKPLKIKRLENFISYFPFLRRAYIYGIDQGAFYELFLSALPVSAGAVAVGNWGGGGLRGKAEPAFSAHHEKAGNGSPGGRRRVCAPAG